MANENMIPISKGKKVFVIICSVVAVLSLVLYILGRSVIANIPVELVIPSGNLTDNLFVRQNMEYKAVNGMTRQYFFADMPYGVDVAEGQTVNVGGADILYHEPYYFYYHVLPVGEELLPSFTEQIAKVLAPNMDTSKTLVSVLQTESGNYNGCYGTYQILSIKAPSNPEYYMFLYRMHIDESIYESDKDMVVGCMISQLTTESLASAQSLAQATFGTLQYNEGRGRVLEEQKKEQQKQDISLE